MAGRLSKPQQVGLLIVGDEILSGKRRDRHFAKVIDLLGARGIPLAWAQMVGDDETQIAEAIRAGKDRGDVVLSCGGIGATPDDLTRQAAARAFDVPIERHREAEALIVDQYGDKAHPHRVLMADFPKGAAIIPNPVNNVAGFSIGHCYFVPGFPEMAWPMLAWVLDQKLAHLRTSEPNVEFSLRASGSSAEGDLLPLMEETLRRFAGVKLSSLPFRGDATRPRHIEFGIKGPRAVAAEAFRWLRGELSNRPEIKVEDLKSP